mmetsp:Transcript_81540/g.239443  ORF Transcript_81540/g.239443 Transcript_81540/m.239443 type:complete len:488 (-) Transcript_81540:28-1491(-)
MLPGDGAGAALAQLRDVFPAAESKALEQALASCNGSVEAAVERLLASSTLASSAPEAGPRHAHSQARDGCTKKAEWSQLRDMFPSASADSLQRAFESCGGNAELAAIQLLDQPTVKTIERSRPKPVAISASDVVPDGIGRVSSEVSSSEVKPAAAEASFAAASTLWAPTVPRPATGPTEEATKASSATALRSLLPGKEVSDQQGAQSAGHGRLICAADVKLPLSKMLVPPACSMANAIEFSWGSLKTKTSLQSGNFGPEAGSTWLWFLVAELEATHKHTAKDSFMDVHIVGDKFQAGWLPDPGRKVSAAALRKNHCSMLQSALDGTLNEYGSSRGGTPEGFSHAWRYSDSSWTTGRDDASWPTSAATWTEVKRKDRWRVDIQMQWLCANCVKEGRYLFIAEQRAEKLNPNQYATAMRGAMVHIMNDMEGRDALERMIRLYQGDAGKRASGTEQEGGLLRWVKKRPAPESMSPQPDSPQSAQASPAKQ